MIYWNVSLSYDYWVMLVLMGWNLSRAAIQYVAHVGPSVLTRKSSVLILLEIELSDSEYIVLSCLWNINQIYHVLLSYFEVKLFDSLKIRMRQLVWQITVQIMRSEDDFPESQALRANSLNWKLWVVKTHIVFSWCRTWIQVSSATRVRISLQIISLDVSCCHFAVLLKPQTTVKGDYLVGTNLQEWLITRKSRQIDSCNDYRDKG